MVESTTKKLDQYLDNDQQEIINQHQNAKGDMTIVFENKETGDRKTFPNVNPDNLEGDESFGGGGDDAGNDDYRGGGSSDNNSDGRSSGKQGFASMPKEQVREIASMGGKASGEARRAKSDNIV